MKNSKFIANIVLFCLVIGLITGFLFLSPTSEISESERRKLQQFPEISVSNLVSGKFMREFETYMTDQFPLRDAFRRLKAKVHFSVMNQKDNGGIYVKDGFVSKIDSEINQSSLDHFTDRMTSLYNTYMKDKNCNVFYTVIPDKNYYLADESYPTLDYDKLFSYVDEKLSYMTKIDIADTLSKDSFYFTDTHWRQEKITATAEKIRKEMGMSPLAKLEEEKVGDFYGVYYGQSALDLPKESLSVLKSEATEKSSVYNFEADKTTAVYDREKFNGLDSYDIFLSGAVSLLEITNPTGEKGKQLVIVRDSFGSSLAPLLMSDYEKIVLVDIRYIAQNLLGNYVDFEGSDVLIVYSTLMINDSSTLK